MVASTRASKLFSPVASWVMREVVGTGLKFGSLKMARHQGSEKSEAISLNISKGAKRNLGIYDVVFEVEKLILRIALIVNNVFVL